MELPAPVGDHGEGEMGEGRGRRRSRRSVTQVSARNRHRRIRLLYFALASVWGFTTGTVAILASIAATGHPVSWGSRAGVVIALAVIVAVLGGFIAARAYRDATSRH